MDASQEKQNVLRKADSPENTPASEKCPLVMKK